ncbi:unnamed protein product [Lactuca virosa]|uniref:Uncharacterized protein n=1 Tax=Lactuca virosa TaxID=75947 RepID=A0AAU9MP63_9ASTR|nr:unnamed protein product [Lactuca virosa]
MGQISLLPQIRGIHIKFVNRIFLDRLHPYQVSKLYDVGPPIFAELGKKKLWGHDLTHHELFLYTQAKNHDGVTFLVDKAKKIHDDFMERCDRLEAIGEEIDDDKLFYDVVGGHDRKKRLYEFGSYGTHIRSSKGSSETHREQYEDNNVETKVEIENLKK